MIIGLLGTKGCGKSTIANHLRDAYGFIKLSWADPIKDVCAIIFGYDRIMLDGETPEHRKWRETVDFYWAEKLGIPDFSPRKAMTMVGTDIIRKYIHDDMWTESLLGKIKPGMNYVVADCRHMKETPRLIERGGIVIRIEKDTIPKWESIAILASHGDETAQLTMKDMGIHSTEYEWLAAEYTHLIKNDSDIKTLLSKVEAIIGNKK